MDLLFTPPSETRQSGIESPSSLLAPQFLDACVTLIDWLRALNQDLRLVIYLASESGAAREQEQLAARLLQARRMPLLALLELKDTPKGSALFPALRMAREAILVDDGCGSAEAEALRHECGRYLAEARAQGVEARWRLWLRRHPDGAGHTRLNQYEPGLFDIREQPLFSLGAAPGEPRIDLPPFLAAEPIPCALFETVVTIAPDGVLRMCPRQAGKVAPLAATTPEDLFRAKGRLLDDVGRMPCCIHCDIPGRFYWPAGRVAAIENLMNDARGQAVTQAAPLVELPETFDLSAATPEEQESALADFEKHLQDWANQMTAPEVPPVPKVPLPETTND